MLADFNAIATLLHSVRFHVDDEKSMQSAMGKLFTDRGLVFEREVKLSDRDRIDFFFRDIGVGVELKTKGVRAAVLRQLARYNTHKEVSGLILVTTRRQLAFMPSHLEGKPVVTVLAGGPF